MEKGGREARKELNLLTALLAVQSKAQVRGCVVSFGAAWAGLASHAGSSIRKQDKRLRASVAWLGFRRQRRWRQGAGHGQRLTDACTEPQGGL